MTIRTLFSSYCLDYAKILIINDADDRFVTLFPAFNDPEDEDFKRFESYADEIIIKWYYEQLYNRFVITIEKEVSNYD